MRTEQQHVRPNDVKSRYFAGGDWKAKIIPKMGKHRHEATRMGGRYWAIPPEDGWKGGLPSDNGYRAGKGK